MSATNTAPAPEVSEVLEERKPKVFRYMGNNSLVLKGINSGRVYHFRFPGDTVEVVYEDSFALMAERDLIPNPDNLTR